MSKYRYSIYVVELSKKVFSENRKFRQANPQFNGVLECLYVGMTSKDPKRRFEEHLTGAKSKKGHTISASIVQRYGLYLIPSFTEHLHPKSRKEAIAMEEDLSRALRRQRYAVWWG